ncbi:MAG: cytochrome B [Alteromonadaceae bacterium]|nr:MAG: cytochrome B [Alteromonadaceae bacterium]
MLQRSLFQLTLFAFCLACAVILMGAFTRLADAGLGCPDWPTCYGHLWVPTSDADVHHANLSFADTPVERDKTWPEQLHRILASTLGLIILILFFMALYQRRKLADRHPWISISALLGLLVAGTITRIVKGSMIDPYLLGMVLLYFGNLAYIAKRHHGSKTVPFKLPAFLAGFVVVQGLFGMWTVTLKLWPQVVTLHLLGGFATVSLLCLLLQRLAQWHWRLPYEAHRQTVAIRPFAMLVLIVVAIQIALGGWISSNYAALACPDFPLCQNQLWPQADFLQGFNIFQGIGPNYLGGLLENQARTAIHLSHRIGALITTVLVLILAIRLFGIQLRSSRILAFILIVILALQVALGVSNVVLSLPLAVAVAHNGVGALLLVIMVIINHRVSTARQ